jgi:hypothetical protein
LTGYPTISASKRVSKSNIKKNPPKFKWNHCFDH